MLADLKQQIDNFKASYEKLLELQGEAMELSAEPSRHGLKSLCMFRWRAFKDKCRVIFVALQKADCPLVNIMSRCKQLGCCSLRSGL